MQTKLAAVLAEAAAGGRVNVSAVCRDLGISRKHYYALRRRFAAGGVQAVTVSMSRRPQRSPGQPAAAVEHELVRWRKLVVEDGLARGGRQIRDPRRGRGVRTLAEGCT